MPRERHPLALPSPAIRPRKLATELVHDDGSAGLPVRLDHVRARRRVTIEAECMRLIGMRQSIDKRLGVLLRALEQDRPALPLSGLVQAAPSVLLFKGGRHAS